MNYLKEHLKEKILACKNFQIPYFFVDFKNNNYYNGVPYLYVIRT